MNGLTGLVACGGQSSRMGQDKYLLVYRQKPEVFRLYEMLEKICKQVFISCNQEQAAGISNGFNTLTDLPAYSGCGPLSALITAYNAFPRHHFLLIGCDYPYLHAREMERFITFVSAENSPAAFYNASENLYEPLLAYYPAQAGNRLTEMYRSNQWSLQQYLQDSQARKYLPLDARCMISVDTYASFEKAKRYFEELKNVNEYEPD